MEGKQNNDEGKEGKGLVNKTNTKTSTRVATYHQIIAKWGCNIAQQPTMCFKEVFSLLLVLFASIVEKGNIYHATNWPCV